MNSLIQNSTLEDVMTSPRRVDTSYTVLENVMTWRYSAKDLAEQGPFNILQDAVDAANGYPLTEHNPLTRLCYWQHHGDPHKPSTRAELAKRHVWCKE